MRNLGLFSPTAIVVTDLGELGSAIGGQLIGDQTMRFGEVPNEAYLDLSTDLANGCLMTKSIASSSNSWDSRRRLTLAFILTTAKLRWIERWKL